MSIARRTYINILLNSVAVGALASSALAGGFAVREQSTLHQGASFAGSAAGSSLSTMFWNSAAAAFAPSGLSTDSNYAVIIPESKITAQPGTTPALLGLSNASGDIAKDAIVPASYAAYRLNDKAVLALGINSPFGLVTEPENPNWSGRNFARTSSIKTYNFNPTLGYMLTPTVAVGAGVQIEYIDAKLKQAASPALGSQSITVEGDDIAVGFTLGVMWAPRQGTALGLGFRSALDHRLDGTISIVSGALPSAGITADVTLPEVVTLSLRQALDPKWTLLGTVEWTNWSRLERLNIVCKQAGGFCAGAGAVVNSIALNWHDGWLFSLGAEYAYSPSLTLRGGLAYEISPIQNPSERTPRVPDSDRFWASIGASYAWSPATSIDLAYTHIFVDDARLDRTEGGLRLVGNVDASVDIISLGLRHKFGGQSSPEPLK